ncbi:hypothetical protein PC114_g22172 [Phytophthora cactorum]|nr:hypothetical protein PC114_g22172 [Phytophthora cactorum]
MAFFKLKKTEAEKAQQRSLKELERVAKTQRKHAAKEHKAAKRQEKKAQKEAQQAHNAAQKSHRQAVKLAKKASKSRIRLARKAEKKRVRLHRRQMQRARREAAAVAAGGVVVPPLAKSAGCYVCGKKFGQALHRRRHHCRQCRESCCVQCTSSTRRPVPLYGLHKPQKVCVVCETLVLNNENAARSQPREPAEAVAALAASGRASRRPHSAPLPPTTGVTVTTRGRERGRTRSTRSKGGSFWTLPIRPLLKRKKSAEQLRNRKLDMDLQIEKRALFGAEGGACVVSRIDCILTPAKFVGRGANAVLSINHLHRWVAFKGKPVMQPKQLASTNACGSHIWESSVRVKRNDIGEF